LIDSTPDLRLVDSSCSRSGSGISSITPDIGRPAVELWRAAPASSLRRASASVVAAAAIVDLHDLDDRGADQDAIALAQPGAAGDLLAVDEGAVGRPDVLDE
jgi:hypothetical protein